MHYFPPSRWKKYDFGINTKVHVMPVGDPSETVINDLENRGSPLLHCEDTTETILDCPGMILANRPWSNFEIDGLKLGIACENVSYFLSYGARLKDRGGYFKWHSWNHCLVLSPAQHFILLGKIETELPSAEKRDEEFYNAWRSKHGFNKAR